MGFLFWAVAAVLGLALVNGVAFWLGLDVAGSEAETEGNQAAAGASHH